MTDDFDAGDKVRRWTTNLDDPSEALTQIGEMMVSESIRAFKRQRFGKSPWKQRAPINVYGIIADFAKAGGAKPPKRRFQRRPALVDTGHLRGSIGKSISGKTVVVGTVVPYAAAHHEGGEVKSQKITESVQKKLWKWLKGPGKKYKKDLGWLLNKKFTGTSLTMTVPKRPIVGLTKQTKKDIERLIGAKVMEVD